MNLENPTVELQGNFLRGCGVESALPSPFLDYSGKRELRFLLYNGSEIMPRGIVLMLQGFTRSIITDKVPKSVNALCRAFTTRLGVDRNITTANHPSVDDHTVSTKRTLA